MKRAPIAALAGLALALAATAPSAAPPKRPRVADLPAGAAPVLLATTPPARIGAGEHAEGFHVGRPYGHRETGKDQPQYAMVFGNEEVARSFSSGRGFGSAPDDRTCLLSPMNVGHRSPFMGAGQTPEVVWMPSFHNTASVGTHTGGGVVPVRSERLTVLGEGRAELAVAHAWVDAVTLGARLISRGTIPLARIAEGPGGVEVYAAKRTDAVEIVVTSSAPASARQRLGGMQFQGSNGMAGSQSGCGHLRFTLRAAPGAADMATVQAEIALGPADPAEKRSLLGSVFGGEAPQETRVRSLRLGVSTSWASRDAEPVLSVGMGWTGRERVF